MSLCHRHQSTECGIEDNQEEECFLAYLDNEVSSVAYIQGELIVGIPLLFTVFFVLLNDNAIPCKDFCHEYMDFSDSPLPYSLNGCNDEFTGAFICN